MTEHQKMILELAAQFLIAHIKRNGIDADTYSAHYALHQARYIANGAIEENAP